MKLRIFGWLCVQLGLVVGCVSNASPEKVTFEEIQQVRKYFLAKTEDYVNAEDLLGEELVKKEQDVDMIVFLNMHAQNVRIAFVEAKRMLEEREKLFYVQYQIPSKNSSSAENYGIKTGTGGKH